MKIAATPIPSRVHLVGAQRERDQRDEVTGRRQADRRRRRARCHAGGRGLVSPSRAVVRSGSPDEVRGRELGDRAAAGEMERDGELLAQELEHLARSLLPAGRETPERHPAGEHGPARRGRAPSPRRCRAGSRRRSSTSSRSPTASTIGRQRLERRHRAVELTATVVRDHDARRRRVRQRGRRPRGRGCP